MVLAICNGSYDTQDRELARPPGSTGTAAGYGRFVDHQSEFVAEVLERVRPGLRRYLDTQSVWTLTLDDAAGVADAMLRRLDAVFESHLPEDRSR